MCLSIAVNAPDHVLSSGEHVGYEWTTVHNGMGYRCGYIRIPRGHPWYGRYYDDVDANVHGGLTFGERDKPCAKGGADDGFWYGFDCAHYDDAPDPSLPNDYTIRLNRPGTIRTQSYVEAQCRSLCEQAAAAAAAYAETQTQTLEQTQHNVLPPRTS